MNPVTGASYRPVPPSIRFGRALKEKERKTYEQVIPNALKALEKDNLLMAIHDQSFPSTIGQDLGRGSPYSAAAKDYMTFVKQMGFSGLLFGPQGLTSDINQSPYDSTIFAKNILSISLLDLTTPEWGRILPPMQFAEILRHKPPSALPGSRVAYRYVLEAYPVALKTAFENFVERKEQPSFQPLKAKFEKFKRENTFWLDADSLIEALSIEHKTDDWKNWDNAIDRGLLQKEKNEEPKVTALKEARKKDIRERYDQDIEFFKFCQFVVHEQHQKQKEFAKQLGLTWAADLQIGTSNRDYWAYKDVFLEGYWMGAPPSRTNPDGQPWGYPIFDPSQLKEGQPAYEMMKQRLNKLFSEFDKLRLDHPHGLVDPFGYEENTDIAKGRRIFSSPDVKELEDYARIRKEDLNTEPGMEPYYDRWVRTISDKQLQKYRVLFDLIVQQAKANGRDPKGIICEVLSTMPYPLDAVRKYYGLGRFRVTQNADPKDPQHVYHAKNADPQDWAMVSTHDKIPLSMEIDNWRKSGIYPKHIDYMTNTWAPTPYVKAKMRQNLRNPAAMLQAKFAELFASPSRNIMFFFPDVFGIRQVYNKPGIVDDENWTLRVPDNFRREYYDGLIKGQGLNLPDALGQAIEMRGNVRKNKKLVVQLNRLSAILKQPEGREGWMLQLKRYFNARFEAWKAARSEKKAGLKL